jgi:hypothetical protein
LRLPLNYEAYLSRGREVMSNLLLRLLGLNKNKNSYYNVIREAHYLKATIEYI